MPDDAFHRLEDTGKGLLEVIGEHKDFVRCFLSESPCQGQSAVKRGLAALLDAAVQDRIPRQAVILMGPQAAALPINGRLRLQLSWRLKPQNYCFS